MELLGRFDPKYLALAEAVARAINEADPIGLLAIGAPSDEYDPEHRRIVPRVAHARDEDTVAAILYEEFVRLFGAGTAGPFQNYAALAVRIWPHVQEFQTHQSH